MTAVLIHGVPETSALWGPLAAELAHHEVVLLGLPGFGSALPDGFDPTMESYAAWLRNELDSMPGPLHLVAHDWGALLAMRVLADRPEHVASWVLDMGNLDDDFAWHDLAQIWQTPGAGEEAVAGMAPGSVIVDLAAETGGNCELTEPGETVVVDGVKVIGPSDLPSDLPGHASQLYSKNVENLLSLMIADDGSLHIDFSDDFRHRKDQR